MRNFAVSASDQLKIIDEAYAEKVSAADRRLDELAQQEPANVEVHPGVAEGRGTVFPPTIVTSERTLRESLRITSDGIRTLIDVVRVGQEEADRSGKRLGDLTASLVRWTKVIGIATLVAVVVAVIALVLELRP